MAFGIDVLVSLVAASLSLLAPLVEQGIRQLAGRLGVIQPAEVESYSERLTKLTDSLTRSTAEVDAILAELTQVAREREIAVKQLETELAKLTSDEQQLKQRIQELQNVPISVAEHFAQLTASGEKRSARRDYFLFGAGVIVSTVITILLGLLGIGG